MNIILAHGEYTFKRTRRRFITDFFICKRSIFSIYFYAVFVLIFICFLYIAHFFHCQFHTKAESFNE